MPTWLASVLGLFGSGGFGLFVYWLRARIDVWRMGKSGEVSAAQTPLTVLKQALDNQSAMLREANTRIDSLVTNHLARESEKHEALVQAITELNLTMKAVADSVTAHREEESRRASEAHRDMEVVANRLTAIEVKTGLRGT